VDDADYQVPFPFTGKIIKLTVKLGPEELSAEEKGVIHKTFRDKQ
jgi:arylsulfatase